LSVQLWNILIGLVAISLATASRHSSALGQLTNLTVMAIGVYGTWLVTTPEPGAAPRNDQTALGGFLRTMAIAGFWVGVLQAFGPFDRVAAAWLGGGVILLRMVRYVAELTYLGRFALRIPDMKLAQDTRTVLWGWSISFAVMLLGTLTTSGSRKSPLQILGGFGVLLFSIFSVHVLLRYRSAFAKARTPPPMQVECVTWR
jgi:hypothetical protein